MPLGLLLLHLLLTCGHPLLEPTMLGLDPGPWTWTWTLYPRQQTGSSNPLSWREPAQKEALVTALVVAAG